MSIFSGGNFALGDKIVNDNVHMPKREVVAEIKKKANFGQHTPPLGPSRSVPQTRPLKLRNYPTIIMECQVVDRRRQKLGNSTD